MTSDLDLAVFRLKHARRTVHYISRMSLIEIVMSRAVKEFCDLPLMIQSETSSSLVSRTGRAPLSISGSARELNLVDTAEKEP